MKRIDMNEVRMGLPIVLFPIIVTIGCFLAYHYLDGAKGMWLVLGAYGSIVSLFGLYVMWDRMWD